MMSQPDLWGDSNRGAWISPDGKYRYRLWRRWGPGDLVAFVMLNPSTADGKDDDPTLRRCIGYAKAWGFDALEVVNLFAWRATKPKDMPAGLMTTIGRDNDMHIAAVGSRAALIVAAWGALDHRPPAYRARARSVHARLLEPHAIAITDGGDPRHPLYLAKVLKPSPYPEIP
jgi:hypothetical protein